MSTASTPHLPGQPAKKRGSEDVASSVSPEPPQVANGHPSARNDLSRLFQTYKAWFIGLCFCNIWIGWMNGAHALKPMALWDVLCAVTIIAVLIGAICHGHRHPESVRGPYPPDWPIALCMSLFTPIASGALLGDSTAMLWIATIATEIGMAWFYIRWGTFLSKLDLRLTVGCIFTAHVVGCMAKLALFYIPTSIATVPVMALPVASMGMLRAALKRAEAHVESAGTKDAGRQPVGAPWCSGRGTWGPLWKVAAFVFCYRLLFQAAAFARTSTVSGLSLSTICCLAEIAISLIIVYMLLVRSGSFTFQQVWSIFLLLLGVSLLFTSMPALSQIGVAIQAATGSLLVMFTWLVFADIAHHSTLHPFAIFGIARISYEMPRLLCEGAILAKTPVPIDEPTRVAILAVLFFLLLVFAIWFFDWRDPTLALLFSDFQQRKYAPTTDTVRLICEEAASEHGLTAREAQVLLYLCQGRTRAYIAESLYLSENTVRGHTQRIYAKLGVHNKTELQRLLGV